MESFNRLLLILSICSALVVASPAAADDGVTTDFALEAHTVTYDLSYSYTYIAGGNTLDCYAVSFHSSDVSGFSYNGLTWTDQVVDPVTYSTYYTYYFFFNFTENYDDVTNIQFLLAGDGELDEYFIAPSEMVVNLKQGYYVIATSKNINVFKHAGELAITKGGETYIVSPGCDRKTGKTSREENLPEGFTYDGCLPVQYTDFYDVNCYHFPSRNVDFVFRPSGTNPSTEPSTEASTKASTEPSTEASTEPYTETSSELSTESSTESLSDSTKETSNELVAESETSTTSLELSSESGSQAQNTTAQSSEVSYSNSTITSTTKVEDLSTTVVTITSCEETECFTTDVTTGVTVVTTIENGVVTAYTTYCPLPTETTVITVISCEEDICTETVITCDETCVDVLTTSVDVPIATTKTETNGQTANETGFAVRTKVTKTATEGTATLKNDNGEATGKATTVAPASVTTAEVAPLSTYEGSAAGKVASSLLAVCLFGLLAF